MKHCDSRAVPAAAHAQNRTVRNGNSPRATAPKRSTRKTWCSSRRRSSRPRTGQLKIEVNPNNTLFKLERHLRRRAATARSAAGETIMTSLVKDIPIAGADSVPFVVEQLRRCAAPVEAAAAGDREAFAAAAA